MHFQSQSQSRVGHKLLTFDGTCRGGRASRPAAKTTELPPGSPNAAGWNITSRRGRHAVLRRCDSKGRVRCVQTVTDQFAPEVFMGCARQQA